MNIHVIRSSMVLALALLLPCYLNEEIRALQGGPPCLLHVTNSRHGLAEGITTALIETSAVHAVIYNSCNQMPLATEWAEFCASGGFHITEFASSDLLAGN